MTEMAGPGTWRVAWGPGQVDEDGDEWAVVFRLDALGRDAEGPQIVVTSTALTEYDSYDPEADDTYDVEYSYTTRFAFQVWAPDGDLIALVSKQAPYSWHNWAVDIDDARDKAMWIVQESAADPGYWATWDGTAGFSGVAEPGPHVPDWLDVPARTVVSLRRQFRGRAREQWAIVHHVNGLTVEHGDPEREEWEETGAGPFGSVTVQFTGVAGHAGMPHRAVDPIVSVASFVLQIQAMIARNFDPATGGVVLTFGTISGGTVVNGVAASATVMGTLRFLDAAQHDLAFKRIREIAEGVALATGATAAARLEDSPRVPVINDPQITARFTDYMRSRAGVTFQDAPVTMASEDYGYLIDRIPGMMFWLGTGRGHPLHSGKFTADETAIEPAVRLIGDYLAQL